MPTHETVYDELLAEWVELTALDRVKVAATVDRWTEALNAMTAEQTALVAAGQWLSGGHTMLHAMGVAYDEVRMCAGLAWLLDPAGRHGLGTSMLRAFLAEVGVTGLDEQDLAAVRVAVEETSEDGSTRADILIRLPHSGRCVLVEAKIWALEQPTQCARLAEFWAVEDPVLVFLTRSGHAPTTAAPDDGWVSLRWRRLAELVRSVQSDAWSAGVVEYVETIEHYGG